MHTYTRIYLLKLKSLLKFPYSVFCSIKLYTGLSIQFPLCTYIFLGHHSEMSMPIGIFSFGKLKNTQRDNQYGLSSSTVMWKKRKVFLIRLKDVSFTFRRLYID